MTNTSLPSQLKLPLPILNNLKVDVSLKVETCPDSDMKKIWTLSGMQNSSSVLVCGTYWLSPSRTGYIISIWFLLHNQKDDILLFNVTSLWHWFNISVKMIVTLMWHWCDMFVTLMWHDCDTYVTQFWHCTGVTQWHWCNMIVPLVYHHYGTHVTWLRHNNISVTWFWHNNISVTWLWHWCNTNSSNCKSSLKG